MATRKPARRIRNARKPKGAAEVFLNLPYDPAFENLLLAYIAAISAFGCTPRATLEIPSNRPRLDRILALIQQSEYSIHDLSRVELDRTAPPTPRFNMPFELGLTVAVQRTSHRNHAWIVCESKQRRINKSLSDLDGTDAYIHDGTIKGVFREMGNAFVGNSRRPTVSDMMRIYRVLRSQFKTVLRRAGARDAFNASVFKELCILASTVAGDLSAGGPPLDPIDFLCE